MLPLLPLTSKSHCEVGSRKSGGGQDPRTQIAAYQRLIRQVEVFASWLVLPWDEDAANHFDSLKSLRQQVGTQDLKIACICLAHDTTLLTRNLADFKPIPGLRVANWLD